MASRDEHRPIGLDTPWRTGLVMLFVVGLVGVGSFGGTVLTKLNAIEANQRMILNAQNQQGADIEGLKHRLALIESGGSGLAQKLSESYNKLREEFELHRATTVQKTP